MRKESVKPSSRSTGSERTNPRSLRLGIAHARRHLLIAYFLCRGISTTWLLTSRAAQYVAASPLRARSERCDPASVPDVTRRVTAERPGDFRASTKSSFAAAISFSSEQALIAALDAFTDKEKAFQEEDTGANCSVNVMNSACPQDSTRLGRGREIPR